MVQRQGGSRRKSRHKLTKPLRAKGKLSIRNFLQEFKAGEKVVLKTEPSVQAGAFHMRHQGKVGMIKDKQGSCYRVTLIDGNKEKLMIIHPIHLRKA